MKTEAFSATAEGLPRLSRRAALLGVVSLPLTAVHVGSEPATPEHAVTRVDRLSTELAYALDDWMADMRSTGQTSPLYEAHVWPASSGRGFYYKNASLRDTPQERMQRARRELVEATKAAYPEITDWRTVVDDDEADSGVCGMFMFVGHRPGKWRA